MFSSYQAAVHIFNLLTETSKVKTNPVSPTSSWKSTTDSNPTSPSPLWSKGPLWHPGQVPNMKDGAIIEAYNQFWKEEQKKLNPGILSHFLSYHRAQYLTVPIRT
jgi:hypothetical protein